MGIDDLESSIKFLDELQASPCAAAVPPPMTKGQHGFGHDATDLGIATNGEKGHLVPSTMNH